MPYRLEPECCTEFTGIRGWLLRLLNPWLNPSRSHRKRRTDLLEVEDVLITNNFTTVRGKRKPPWVADEVIRMKASCPNLGCRKLADAFNRRFAVYKDTNVSKSYVGRVLKARQYEVLRLRKTIRHRVPRPMRKNVTWGLDLTHVTDTGKQQRMVLGILDHATRACIALRELNDKRSLTILREIIAAIRHYGTPRNIRVDNDACLKSRLMRFGLALLRIRLQVTQPGCPWMNGRIERMFGTFKHSIRKIEVINGEHLAIKLIEFRAYYNHVRTHQHLGGRTPAEAWCGARNGHSNGELIELWKGALGGWYFPLRE